MMKKMMMVSQTAMKKIDQPVCYDWNAAADGASKWESV
jgi:hypothetical protein